LAGSAYSFGVTEVGQVVHRYWGERLPFAEDYPKIVEVKDADSFNMAETLMWKVRGILSLGLF